MHSACDHRDFSLQEIGPKMNQQEGFKLLMHILWSSSERNYFSGWVFEFRKPTAVQHKVFHFFIPRMQRKTYSPVASPL